MRKWLLEKVFVNIEGVNTQLTRMELFEKLYQIYLNAKADWKKEKQEKLNEAKKSSDTDGNQGLEDFAEWFASYGAVRDAQIDGYFDDLVVRGYYHEVMMMLGYLDNSSQAELIEDTKSKMRNSSMMSLDESSTIYPVQMQPVDWFTALSTDFTPVDLLMDPEFIKAQIISKENQLDGLQYELQSLEGATTGNIDELQKEVDVAQSAYDNAQSNMIKNFGNTVVSLFQMYFAQKNKKKQDLVKGDFDKELQNYGSGPLSDDQWKQITDMQNKAVDCQQSLLQSSRALSDLQAKLAAANATDTKNAQLTIKNQIIQITQDLTNLKELYNSQYTLNLNRYTPSSIPATIKSTDFTSLTSKLNAADAKVMTDNYAQASADADYTLSPTVTDDSKLSISNILNSANFIDSSSTSTLLPSSPPKAGTFMDVIMTFTKNTTSSTSSLTFGSSQTSWSVDVLFGSASGSSSSSYSDFTSKYTASKSSFSIGMRVMKVTIDRGGWFNPEILEHMEDMFKLGTARISHGLPAKPSQPTDIEMQQRATDILPAFPVSFIIAKDVTIKIDIDKQDQETAKHYLHSESSVGGGFLCFGASHSKSSTSQSQSFYSNVASDNIIIRIPGPQILGWYLQYTKSDETISAYQKMPDSFLPVDNLVKVVPTEPTVPDVTVQEHLNLITMLGAPQVGPARNPNIVVISGHGIIANPPNNSFDFRRSAATKSTVYYYTFDNIGVYDRVGHLIEQNALDRNAIYQPYASYNESRIGGTQIQEMLLYYYNPPEEPLNVYFPIPAWNHQDYNVLDSTGRNNVTIRVLFNGVDLAHSNRFQVIIPNNVNYWVKLSTIISLPAFANLSCDFLWAACKVKFN
jgi:hypothetical protein